MFDRFAPNCCQVRVFKQTCIGSQLAVALSWSCKKLACFLSRAAAGKGGLMVWQLRQCRNSELGRYQLHRRAHTTRAHAMRATSQSRFTSAWEGKSKKGFRALRRLPFCSVLDNGRDNHALCVPPRNRQPLTSGSENLPVKRFAVGAPIQPLEPPEPTLSDSNEKISS